jgi:hypothetical protein
MLTSNTKRVHPARMFFTPIISRWGEAKLAEALRLPVKNVRRWVDTDSIPGGWYQRVADTGIATLVELAAAGTARDIASEQKRRRATGDQAAA